jgi:putative component of toxin-antitoxin plasmid stabilization module
VFEVKRTDALDSWLKGLADAKGRAKIQARIDRLANGNPGDVAPIGDKGTQDGDIKNAHAMWKVLTPLAKKPGRQE